MEILIKKNMIQDGTTWIDIVNTAIKWLSGSYAFVFAINKIVNSYFSYKVKFFDERTESLIDKKMNPQIEKLSHSIDELKEAIWEMKKK